jgi:RHS repeat-associated protein
VLSHVFHVYVEGRPLAEVQEDSGGARTTYYLHEDSVGSVVAVTDAAGSLVQRIRHDPFGERHATTASGAPTTPVSSRGFTFHEHETGFGWINMGGRIYDPTYGTFLTPDPLIRTTLSADALNPYEYVEGRVLTATDPTGLWCDDCNGFWDVFSRAVSTAGQLITEGVAHLLSPGSAGVQHQSSGTSESHRPRSQQPAPPAVADATGSSAGDTANSGAGVHQASMRAWSGTSEPVPRRAAREYLDGLYRRGDYVAHRSRNWAWDLLGGFANRVYSVSPPGLLRGNDIAAAYEDDFGIDLGFDRYSIEYGEFTTGPNLTGCWFGRGWRAWL